MVKSDSGNFGWRLRRRATTYPGVAELPLEGIVLSQRQTVIRILKGIPLWLVGAAVAVLLTGPLGVGFIVGATLGSAVSALVWRAWERKTGLRAYSPSHPWTWRLGRKNPGPWLYYGPSPDRGS